MHGNMDVAAALAARTRFANDQFTFIRQVTADARMCGQPARVVIHCLLEYLKSESLKTYAKEGRLIVWPDRETLANDLGVGENAIRRALKTAEECGHMRTVSGGHRGCSTRREFIILRKGAVDEPLSEKGAVDEPLSDEKGIDHGAKGARLRRERGSDLSPESLTISSKDESQKESSLRSDSRACARARVYEGGLPTIDLGLPAWEGTDEADTKRYWDIIDHVRCEADSAHRKIIEGEYTVTQLCEMKPRVVAFQQIIFGEWCKAKEDADAAEAAKVEDPNGKALQWLEYACNEILEVNIAIDEALFGIWQVKEDDVPRAAPREMERV
jgi:hypothetical protein